MRRLQYESYEQGPASPYLPLEPFVGLPTVTMTETKTLPSPDRCKGAKAGDATWQHQSLLQRDLLSHALTKVALPRPGVGLSLPGWRQVVPTHARARRLEQMVSWGRGMLVVSDTFSDSLLLTHSLAYTRTNVGWGREQERVPGDR